MRDRRCTCSAMFQQLSVYCFHSYDKAIEFFNHSASSKGWHVQWETVPPGEESEPRSLGCIRGGNEADEAN